MVVGFAAETGDDTGSVLDLARAKLARKGCDLLVVNDVSGGAVFGSRRQRGRRPRTPTASAIDGPARLQGRPGPRRSGTRSRRGSSPAETDVPRPVSGRTVRPFAMRDRRSTDVSKGYDAVTGRLFTSESVTEGHPDKIADQISDSVLDAMLAQDPHSRVAVETLLTTGLVVVAGEVTTTGYVDVKQLVRDRILDDRLRLLGEGLRRPLLRRAWSPSAASPATSPRASTPATSARTGSVDAMDKQGAGDQGLMFGYACDDTPELMPLPITIAQRLAERLTEVRKDGTLAYLRPDGKTQVTIEYDDDDRPVRVDTVVLSTQHAEDIDLDTRSSPTSRSTSSTRCSPTSTSRPRATGCWSTRPAASWSAARWATPA